MIALYLRLSMSDGDLGEDNKDESNSIENQSLLLRRYLDDREDLTGEVTEYIDDGYTGTNFNRPGFKNMIEDCRKGLIKTVLVKDLSRFGRNYIGVGDYIEQLFPLLGIRFIAVNHNYDSNDYIGETMGFDMEVNNLISSLYSRDLSRKRRSTNMIKWKKGIATASAAPYGFIKDKRNKGKWKIDPEAAQVVRIIFDKALEGYNTTGIASFLNEKKTDTPAVYFKKKKMWIGVSSVRTCQSEQLWDNSKVLNILNRYEYTGAFVAGRSSPVHIGSSNTRKKDESDWIIIDDINEAIVTKEEFEKARRVIQKSAKSDYILPRKYLLKGKIKCGNCHLNLAYQDLTAKKVFYCQHGIKTGKYSNCCKDRYPAAVIENTVYHALKNLFFVLKVVGKQVQQQHMKENHLFQKEDIPALEKEMKFLKAEKIRKYELYADGHMNKEVYLAEKKSLSEQIDELSEQIKSLEERKNKGESEYEKTKILTDAADTFLGETGLTIEMVDMFIENIYVYDKERIEIVFKFEDEIRKALDRLEDGIV